MEVRLILMQLVGHIQISCKQFQRPKIQISAFLKDLQAFSFLFTTPLYDDQCSVPIVEYVTELITPEC